MQPISVESSARQIVNQVLSGRFPLYTSVHKGLRRALADTLVVVGQADAADNQSVAGAAAAVRALLALCRLHLHSENQFVHPAMEARRPGSARETAGDHVAHEAAFEELTSDVLAVERTIGRDRAAAVAILYQRLALFVADNYAHMFEEETINQAVLWDAYSDDELRAIHSAILGSHTPEQTRAMLSEMLPAMAPAERAAMFAGARHTMPPDAFNGFVAFAASLISAADAAKLRAAVGVPEPELAELAVA
jgi:Hemerythrin HHE cation binding domain